MMKKKGKKVEEVGLQLPEAIIHHIQSFLNGKEAAQTTLLSKSWYAAWLTRPDLYFDQRYPRWKYDETMFYSYIKKTVERYEKNNLKIHSLWLFSYDSDQSLVKELIIKALKMGATSLHLDLVWSFTLPYEVFGYENLIRLYLEGCKIGIGEDGKVGCSRLKSLTLNSVSVEHDVVGDIISSCPLIEKLSLSMWKPFVFSPFNEGSIVTDSPFKKLKCLLLYSVNVHPHFFKDFSTKFPCLKDLSVRLCSGYKRIQISSPSLECINFEDAHILRAKFDVPCVGRFTFSGRTPPSVTFKTTKHNWESSINLQHNTPVQSSWFLQLNTFLKKLSQSKVSLSLKIYPEGRYEYARKDLQGLTKPEVENVTIRGPHSFPPAIFCTLFHVCRPIYITQSWLPVFHCVNGHFNFTNFVNKRMVHQFSLNSCIAYQRMPGVFDLEEVTVEFYDESVSAWCPRSFDFLVSPEPDHEQRLRLHLRWRH